MRQRFLVTGGAGYVGSHLVAALLDRGDAVTVLDNLRTGHAAAVPGGATLVTADLADGEILDQVLGQGPWDAVFHFASLSQVGESMRMPMRYLLDNAANNVVNVRRRYSDLRCRKSENASTRVAKVSPRAVVGKPRAPFCLPPHVPLYPSYQCRDVRERNWLLYLIRKNDCALAVTYMR